ncbi:hypothetical protein [Thauera propionica]|uniref:hypothetical protein n=1 Tax=Thauera propionica TaxID=2019431 RepID=UPI0023EFCF15|nr:hypothetical protein [Thauera propionica]MDD3674991.1 hypothetical protein [Thauera propionica]
MPKVLIIEPTLVNFGDDRGGVHQDPADMPDVTKDAARVLTQNGRALYLDKRDDPSRGSVYTATPQMVKAAEAMAAARKAVVQAHEEEGGA